MYEQTVNFGVTLTYLVYFLVKSYLNRVENVLFTLEILIDMQHHSLCV